MAVLVILSSLSFGYYQNYVKSVELESAARTISFNLKNAQAKAMTGENNLKWGAHFVNGASDYYETFSTATNYAGGTVKETFYLPGSLRFTNPADNNTLDIIFSKIAGTTTAATVTINSSTNAKNINISDLGRIE
jgi:CHASE3 domain sensor protein